MVIPYINIIEKYLCSKKQVHYVYKVYFKRQVWLVFPIWGVYLWEVVNFRFSEKQGVKGCSFL